MEHDIIAGQAIHGVPNPKPEGPRVRGCAECQNTWMLPLLIQQIQDFQVLLGQAAPMMDPGTFFLYQCLNCGHINQPALVYEGQNMERRLYEELLNIVKEINERRRFARGKSAGKGSE